jgi:hypothetical protein
MRSSELSAASLHNSISTVVYGQAFSSFTTSLSRKVQWRHPSRDWLDLEAGKSTVICHSQRKDDAVDVMMPLMC